MKDTRKLLVYVRTRDCAACNGMFDNLNAIIKESPEIDIVELYADDGEEGSRFATALNGIGIHLKSVPRTYLIEEIEGRRDIAKFERKIGRFEEV